jgi:peptidoglycan/xylan/chitin deacetylase (PgdA/CDA1 family)
MFHRVHGAKSSLVGQGSITSCEFEEILHFVGIKNILSAQEWLFRLKKEKLKNSHLCLTFDDGLKCQYDICLPILEKYNLNVFWFIYSSVFEGKPVKSEVYSYFATKYFKNMDDFFRLFFARCKRLLMDWASEYEARFKRYAQETLVWNPFYSSNDLKFRFIREELFSKEEFENIMDAIMQEKGARAGDLAKNLWLSNSELKDLNSKGHCLGLHSYDHPLCLSRLSYKEQFRQYYKNYHHLKKICNKKIISMSHPLNAYNKDTLRVLRRLGIICGFRSNMVRTGENKVNPTPLEMAREDPANILKFVSLRRSNRKERNAQ